MAPGDYVSKARMTPARSRLENVHARVGILFPPAGASAPPRDNLCEILLLANNEHFLMPTGRPPGGIILVPVAPCLSD